MHCTVVKFGGSLLDDDAARARALDTFARLGVPGILVHGGGADATALARRLGIETRMIEGRRVTDRDMLDVVTMVYGGRVNRTLVAGLQARGINACGLTGADFDLIRADRRAAGAVDYGWVGDIRRVDAARLHALLTAGVTPVLAPLTHDGAGNLLNTNADGIASAVAAAMRKFGSVTLLYCLDQDGVRDDTGAVLRTITPADAAALTARGIVRAGMVPKLATAFAALHADAGSDGALRVALCGLTTLHAAWRGGKGAWTEVLP
ncbi:MAG: acetylglutamate kinase [Bacteroidota bacterium]|jgi:acetylglutamate kinase|nr:acetylglutamate kinase [Bacteroidota bacterium]